MRILIVAVLVSQFLLPHATAYSSTNRSDSLVLHLRLDKHKYLFGEDIQATLVLMNTTSRTLAVYPEASSMTTWQIVNEKGEVVCPFMTHWETGPVDLTLLPSGDSLSVFAKACSNYGRSEKMLSDTSCISPGTHVMRGLYCREYYSEPCSLVIDVPTGDELAAYGLLCKAYPKRMDPAKKEEAISALELLCSQHVASVYQEQGFERLAFFYRNRKDFDKVRRVISQFIEAYPDSRYVWRILGHIMTQNTPNPNESFLLEIVANRPGTLAAEAARAFLNQKIGGNK